jgi:benzil reductase ((S)-benzoin forming)
MKSILITGVDTGIGRALFDSSFNDSRIIGIARDKHVVELRNNQHIIVADLSKINKIDQINLENYIDNKDEIVFVNNASIIDPIMVNGNINTSSVVDIFNINCLAPVLLTQKILKISKGIKTTIFNMSSGAAVRPIRGWSLYCSTKAANRMYFETVLAEYPTLNLIQYDPGVVNTGMQSRIREISPDHFPDGRLFHDFHAKGQLRSIKEVVSEIESLLLS